MRPSAVVTSIGTLRYLNQNEQHYTTLPIILLLETPPKLQWSQVLEQRTQSDKWSPWCPSFTTDIKHSKDYKVSTTYLNQNETL